MKKVKRCSRCGLNSIDRGDKVHDLFVCRPCMDTAGQRFADHLDRGGEYYLPN